METNRNVWRDLRKLKDNNPNLHGQPIFLSEEQATNWWILVTKSIRKTDPIKEPFSGKRLEVQGPSIKEAEIILSNIPNSGIYPLNGKSYIWRKALKGDPVPIVTAYGEDAPLIMIPECEKAFWSGFFV